MRWIMIAGIVALAFVVAAVLAAYAFGRFAERAAGPPSHAQSHAGGTTEIDAKIAALSADHETESGLAAVSSNLDAFAARALSARAAGRSLDILYYVWQDDLTGHFLLRELIDAAGRGVRVRLLLDDLGAKGYDEALVTLDAHPSIEVRMFNPTRARENALRRGIEMALRAFSVNRRMHNKAWIADGRVAVVGGRNIGDEYFDAAESSNFRDLDLIVTGPVLGETEAMFDAYWNSGLALPVAALSSRKALPLAELKVALDARLADEALRPYAERIRERVSVFTLLDEDKLHWTTTARLVADPPEKAAGNSDGNTMMQRIVPKLLSAKERLEIISPYFVPGAEGTAAFVDLSARGVEVSVLTNSLAATDVAAVHGGYAPYRKDLLGGGVNLFELRPFGEGPQTLSFRGSSQASLHTKAFTVDDRLGFVGSLNFDPRSASLNTEMGILFEVPELVGVVRDLFRQETRPTDSYRVTLDAAGDLRWTSEEGGVSVVHTREPEASLARRILARVVSWLPLESQL
ncbi:MULTISPECIES: phospholipase D family protein [unclassified Aureimonas]|uniref:phospholipase D family protein n=1 Tax=unclassified Aureimonas TaxID=2615206 RepID=UPI0006FA474F|nr:MULTISPECIES: phospholipase D family protein [unclassified Aureimonas]KQT70037.1 hypothetical protein ASG62_00555 [Aureimonas sp. Leaf427]KQT76320.1 hypothetical protein ASG54_15660 [Aureimonas sp. Leaf460]